MYQLPTVKCLAIRLLSHHHCISTTDWFHLWLLSTNSIAISNLIQGQVALVSLPIKSYQAQ
jgi:hypothetical protein